VAWGLGPACNGMGTSHDPEGLSGVSNGPGNPTYTIVWIQCYYNQKNLSAGVQQAHSQPLSITGTGRTMPLFLILWSSQQNTFVFMWQLDSHPSAYSMAALSPVATHTKHQVHIIIIVQGLLHLISPSLLTDYCHVWFAQHIVQCHSVDRGNCGTDSVWSSLLVTGLLVLPQRNYMLAPSDGIFWACISVRTTSMGFGPSTFLFYFLVFYTFLSFVSATFTQPVYVNRL
jgi:hypothetical protein